MGVVFGLLGDLIMKSGNYASMKKTILGYGVFSLWMIGTYIPMYFMVEQSRADFAAGFGEEYADKVMSVMPMWSIVLVIAGIFLCALLGGLIGKALLKKALRQGRHHLMETLTHSAKRRGLLLDPRTKLLMLITVTSLMLSTGNSGVMNIVKPVLSVLPFILLLTEGRWKTALKYLVLYAVCFALERVTLYCLSGLPAFCCWRYAPS